MREASLLVIVMAGLLAVSGLGAAAPGPQRIDVKASDFAFAPKDLVARPGPMAFVVKNEGAIEHNFVIEDGAKKTVAQIAVIAPGGTEEVRATLQAGGYGVYCSLPGHQEAGMVGTLRVKP